MHLYGQTWMAGKWLYFGRGRGEAPFEIAMSCPKMDIQREPFGELYTFARLRIETWGTQS